MPQAPSCEKCRRALADGDVYHVRAAKGVMHLCRRCAMLHGPMLLRSTKVAILVGTLLVLLNQGDTIFAAGPLPAAFLWKIPLTYCVPFCVATYGALANAKRPEE